VTEYEILSRSSGTELLGQSEKMNQLTQFNPFKVVPPWSNTGFQKLFHLLNSS